MEKLYERAEELTDLGAGRDEYDRDFTAILYSHAFRRLKHKTQVFFLTQDDHVCTRLEHSLYVASIAEIICKSLQRMDDSIQPILARAIGIGHDLGHSPFGHAGESVLNELASSIGGFKHELHSLRVVDRIEKPRRELPIIGLNLTLAVRDGIRNHNGEDKSTSITPNKVSDLGGKSFPCTPEGCVVRLVDKVSYLGRDIEDAIEYEIIDESIVPAKIRSTMGSKNGEIVDYFVRDLIDNSSPERIALSEEASSLMQKLMDFNYDEIYNHVRLENYKDRVNDVIRTLYYRFYKIIRQYEDNMAYYFRDGGLQVVRVLGIFIEKRSKLYFSDLNSTCKCNTVFDAA